MDFFLLFVALNLIEYNLTSAAAQTLQGQGSKCYPALRGIRLTGVWGFRPICGKNHPNIQHLLTLSLQQYFLLASLHRRCLPPPPPPGSLLDFRLWVPLAQTAFASSGHAAAKPSDFSFWVVFQIATVVASQSKSTGAWVFHGEFGKVLAKPLPGSTPVWSVPVAFIGHLGRLCGMS